MSVGLISDHNRKGINDTRGVKKEHQNVTVHLTSELLQILGNVILHHLLLLHEWRLVVGLGRHILVVSMAARPLCHSSIQSLLIFNLTLSSPSASKPTGLSDPQKPKSLIKPRLNLFCLNSKCCFWKKTGQYQPPWRERGGGAFQLLGRGGWSAVRETWILSTQTELQLPFQPDNNPKNTAKTRQECLRDDCECRPWPEPDQTSLERPENGRPLGDISPSTPAEFQGIWIKNIRTSPNSETPHICWENIWTVLLLT